MAAEKSDRASVVKRRAQARLDYLLAERERIDREIETVREILRGGGTSGPGDMPAGETVVTPRKPRAKKGTTSGAATETPAATSDQTTQ